MSAVPYWRVRAALKAAVREFFGARDSLEMDTPIAVVTPGTEVHLRYFGTRWRDIQGAEHQLWLRSSPELHLKQALAGGAPRVFQLAPCFRSGGELADWHHPEFTMLEWYEAGISFPGFVDQTEALLRETLARVAPVVRKELGREPFTLPKTLTRLTVAEAFQRFANLKLVDEDPTLAARAVAAGIESVQKTDDFETAFFKVLLDRVEPGMAALGGCILMDYPPSQAALATVRDGVAKRFEVYLGRVELSNGFEELLARKDNEQRIAANVARRRALGYEAPAEDQDFYAALARGLPPSCGNALGFDRWLALICGEPGIGRVVPFREQGPYRT